jgi:ornithine cyclodeaminase/alanine dehydrogenase
MGEEAVMPLLLTRKDVESVLTMKETIAAVEEGFRQLALGNVTMPQRTAIRLEDHKGLHLGMPAHIGGERGALALKVVTVYPDNPAKHGLPTTIGTLLLNDPRTGALSAIMDAGFLTAMRTGAASGVATRHLARPGASTVGIFGAGVMARTQLAAVCEVRTIRAAAVFDPVRAARDRFAAEMAERLGIEVRAVEDPRACAANEILCLATSSKTPVLEAAWIAPGTHINGVGAHSPDAREVGADLLARATVVADHLPACMAEAGDLILAIQEGKYAESRVHASLGQIVAGSKPGRTSEEEITFFKSVGLAVQDVATASRVFELARGSGVGTEVAV